MKRVSGRGLQRFRSRATALGVSFLLGALAGAWLVDRSSGSSTASPTTADPAPLHDPAEPRPVERPGERGSPAPVALAGAAAHEDAVGDLRDRGLVMPVAGVDADDVRDTFSDARGARAHEAIDILAPKGTPVRAVEDGRVQKLFTSKAGGLTIYQFDPGGAYCYYYAHLDGYAARLREGDAVKRGDIIGFVGASGNASADAPHLHFAIFRLTPERQWWKGEPVNPYPVLKE